MPDESTARNYQSIPDMPQIMAASWRMFCVILSGITNNTHVEFVKMIKSYGHTEVMDPEDCDYCLLFCPITSRVGTDVDLALRKIPANKPTILVVMYHTFDNTHVVPDSRRLTEDPRVKLAVICLFHEHNLLISKCNNTAKYEIRKFLGFPENSRSISSISRSIMRNLSIIRHTIWTLDSLLCFLIWFFHLAWLCCTATARQFICRASWRRFCVILSGVTNNTHVEFVKMIKSHGHTEVMDPEECDYCLLFCPITSRVGKDVDLALRKIPANKPTILVMMYHTFDRNYVVPDSRRLTEDPRVKLAVSCLFYEQKLLNSNCNDTAKYEIKKLLGFPEISRSNSRATKNM